MKHITFESNSAQNWSLAFYNLCCAFSSIDVSIKPLFVEWGFGEPPMVGSNCGVDIVEAPPSPAMYQLIVGEKAVEFCHILVAFAVACVFTIGELIMHSFAFDLPL